MNLMDFLNSKFTITLLSVIPAVILVAKMPVKDTSNAFNCLVEKIFGKVIVENNN